MQNVYSNPSQIEKLAKEKYAVPPFLMMENAARGLAEFILDFSPESVLILCGKGNNGGDGYTAARFLQDKCDVTVVSIEPPATEEAKAQYEMAHRLGIEIVDTKRWSSAHVILDCIYGTGFHGELPDSVKNILDIANKSDAIKIACDIPSGLYFHADYTITMGCQKLALYSDKAKEVCGKIIVADLGLSREKFETTADLSFLIEPSDIILPLRKKRAAHKGTYGHTAVFSGDKGGACILAATAAMKFGSGLTTIINHLDSELSQFKISPELMISEKLPKKTTCILLGPGVISRNESDAKIISEYFQNNDKKHAAVFDAGVFDSKDYISEIKAYSQNEENQIVLTPHLSELNRFLKNIKELFPEVDYSEEDIRIQNLADSPETKIKIGKEINSLFPSAALVMKSANTFIAYKQKIYIIANGAQNLAKGGSGDILAGLIAALLAQGYTAKDAAVTAAFHHAETARSFGEESYSLTPEKFLNAI